MPLPVSFSIAENSPHGPGGDCGSVGAANASGSVPPARIAEDQEALAGFVAGVTKGQSARPAREAIALETSQVDSLGMWIVVINPDVAIVVSGIDAKITQETVLLPVPSLDVRLTKGPAAVKRVQQFCDDFVVALRSKLIAEGEVHVGLTVAQRWPEHDPRKAAFQLSNLSFRHLAVRGRSGANPLNRLEAFLGRTVVDMVSVPVDCTMHATPKAPVHFARLLEPIDIQ